MAYMILAVPQLFLPVNLVWPRGSRLLKTLNFVACLKEAGVVYVYWLKILFFNSQRQ